MDALMRAMPMRPRVFLAAKVATADGFALLSLLILLAGDGAAAIGPSPASVPPVRARPPPRAARLGAPPTGCGCRT